MRIYYGRKSTTTRPLELIFLALSRNSRRERERARLPTSGLSYRLNKVPGRTPRLRRYRNVYTRYSSAAIHNDENSISFGNASSSPRVSPSEREEVIIELEIKDLSLLCPGDRVSKRAAGLPESWWEWDPVFTTLSPPPAPSLPITLHPRTDTESTVSPILMYLLHPSLSVGFSFGRPCLHLYRITRPSSLESAARRDCPETHWSPCLSTVALPRTVSEMSQVRTPGSSVSENGGARSHRNNSRIHF